MAISDYNTSAALNTSLSGINIGEGMSRADVNNAIRQLMADLAAVPGLTSPTVTSAATSYTLSSANSSQMIIFTAATAITVTVAPSLPTNFVCGLVAYGTGQITVSPGSGVTLYEIDSQFKSEARYARLTLFCTEADKFILDGRTAA